MNFTFCLQVFLCFLILLWVILARIYSSVFEHSHVTCFGEWNVSRCLTQQETLKVICCIAYPVASLLTTWQMHVPGSHYSFGLVQRITDTWSRPESELIHVTADCRLVWEINVFCYKPLKFRECLLCSINATTWLTNTRFNFFLFFTRSLVHRFLHI